MTDQDQIPPAVGNAMIAEMDLVELVLLTRVKNDYQETIYGFTATNEYVLVERYPSTTTGDASVYLELRERTWINRVIASNEYRLVAVPNDELRATLKAKHGHLHL
jgi:hypothetical protein